MTDTPEAWARATLDRHVKGFKHVPPCDQCVDRMHCYSCQKVWPCETAKGARHVLSLARALKAMNLLAQDVLMSVGPDYEWERDTIMERAKALDDFIDDAVLDLIYGPDTPPSEEPRDMSIRPDQIWYASTVE